MKIDQSVVNQIDYDPGGEALMRGVIALVQALNLNIVVEGIETAHQARTVHSLGCQQAQGYLFSKPLRPEGIEAILADPERFRTTNLAHLAPTDLTNR